VRIEKLSLNAFRSFHNIELPTPAPRVLIAGVNGTGKTSIREVIKWVLTGRCQGLDGKGTGAEVLSPFGTETGAKAVVDVAGVGRVTRTARNGSSAFAVEGFTGPSQTQQLALYAKLDTTPAFLDAVLDTETFLRLHHADAKALVLNLLNVRIALGDTPDSPVYSLAELDQLYAAAFEDRKVAKRGLQQAILPVKPSETPQPSVAAVEAQLTKLRAEQAALSQAIGETAGRRSQLERQRRNLDKSMPPPVLTPYASEQAMADRRADLEERLSILEADATVDEPVLAPASTQPAPSELTFLRRKSEALSSHRPTKGCVLDSSVPCKTPKAEFTKAAKLVDAELATIPPPETSPLPPVTPLVTELARLSTLQANCDAWRVDEKRRQQQVAAVDAELQTLPETADQETQIAVLVSRIAKGEQIRREAQAQVTATELYEKAEATREGLRAEVERLETLVATLGPSGVRVEALRQAIEKFETHINAYTDRFGWKITFELDPWRVYANDRPVETYSKSEQFRIGIALQLAIAMLSGLGIAVIDELDMLDHQNRTLVTQMVLQAPLDQVFVIGTREPGTPLPHSDQVLAYRLGTSEDGRTIVVERSGSASLWTAA
jgi:hypothetical protein